MAKSRGPQTKSIPMKIGNDSKLWRFESLHDALEVNSELIGALIRAGQEVADTGQSDDVVAENTSILEKV